MFSVYIICSFTAITFDLFEFLHHLCVFLIIFRITRASELPDVETLFYRLNVLVILMALNECAVHAYVIIIEKRKVVIHLNRFYYSLMYFGALARANYDFLNCLFRRDLYRTDTWISNDFCCILTKLTTILWMVLPALIIIIAKWINTKRDFGSFLLESFISVESWVVEWVVWFLGSLSA